MIKITPTPEGGINIAANEGRPVSLEVFDFNEFQVKGIADEINSLRDGSNNKVAFLTMESGRVTFFKHSTVRDEAVYIKDISSQLLSSLKFIELEIVRRWDELLFYANAAIVGDGD